jgi:hypothetical protein
LPLPSSFSVAQARQWHTLVQAERDALKLLEEQLRHASSFGTAIVTQLEWTRHSPEWHEQQAFETVLRTATNTEQTMGDLVAQQTVASQTQEAQQALLSINAGIDRLRSPLQRLDGHRETLAALCDPERHMQYLSEDTTEEVDDQTAPEQ